MGKLYNDLQKQLKIKEYQQDAEDCIKIYNKLEELEDGRVWSSSWNALVNSSFIGNYPNSIRISQPNSKGKVFLCGIEKK